MTDSIRHRVTRIVAAGAHSLVDAAEALAPDAVLRQSIRELDSVVTDVRAELGKAEAAKHVATTRITALSNEHELLGQQIELALAKEAHAEAKAGVEAQLRIEDQLPVLRSGLADAVANIAEQEGYLRALEAKKTEMEGAMQALQAARATQNSAPGSAGPSSSDSLAGRVDRATSSFDRVMAVETGLAGSVGGVAGDAAALASLKKLSQEHRITERLAAIQARVLAPKEK